jgi:hypothetical protein
MINKNQLRDLVIKPTLEYLNPLIPYSDHSVELLMMTAAHESKLGTYIAQVNGPALGVFQMEPPTEVDIWKNFLQYDDDLSLLVEDLMTQWQETPAPDLISSITYATAMARVHYFRDPEPLPSGNLSDERTIWELAKYAKRVYNTEAGKATAQKYYDDYMRYAV